MASRCFRPDQTHPAAGGDCGRQAARPPTAPRDGGRGRRYVHAASLVLDDRPSMDDAKRRRGRPALHITHGVAVAGWLRWLCSRERFERIAGSPRIPVAVRAALAEGARPRGRAEGSCAGQAADHRRGCAPAGPRAGGDPRTQDGSALRRCRAGVPARAARRAVLQSLTVYARNLGLAFQITMTSRFRRGRGALGTDIAATRTAPTSRGSSERTPRELSSVSSCSPP